MNWRGGAIRMAFLAASEIAFGTKVESRHRDFHNIRGSPQCISNIQGADLRDARDLLTAFFDLTLPTEGLTDFFVFRAGKPLEKLSLGARCVWKDMHLVLLLDYRLHEQRKNTNH
ncbi:hypothetical protein FGB62_8g031 [Gracilaria domingensis]|nr:hypothetical protein FGB62_8g031 [Gracilaria domingensis]